MSAAIPLGLGEGPGARLLHLGHPAAVAAAGRRLVAGGPLGALLLEGPRAWFFELGPVEAVFCDGGAAFAAAGGAVHRLDPADGAAPVDRARGRPVDLRDGRAVWACAGERAVRPLGGGAPQPLPLGAACGRVVLFPGGLAWVDGSVVVRAWEGAAPRVAGRAPAPVRTLAAAADGSLLLVFSEGGGLLLPAGGAPVELPTLRPGPAVAVRRGVFAAVVDGRGDAAEVAEISAAGRVRPLGVGRPWGEHGVDTVWAGPGGLRGGEPVWAPLVGDGSPVRVGGGRVAVGAGALAQAWETDSGLEVQPSGNTSMLEALGPEEADFAVLGGGGLLCWDGRGTVLRLGGPG